MQRLKIEKRVGKRGPVGPRRVPLGLAVACVAISFFGGSLVRADEDMRRLPPAVDRMVDYQRDIEPLLARRCLECHGPSKQESSLRVDRRGSLLAGGDLGQPAIKPGSGAESYLLRAVAGLEDDLAMPPDGDRLTAAEVGLLRAWIDQGARFPASDTPSGDTQEPTGRLTTQHWSFQPIRPPATGPVTGGWARGAIDVLIERRLEQAGLRPSPEADRRTLARRLYLDLWGLPPEPEQVDRFEADTRPDAYERLVDHLLASPHYGERWARHWLDVARFAETNGFETNTPRPNAYHYRDYVIQSLNADLPYDQFVAQQLAGDTLGVDAATSFLVGGAYDTVKSPDVNLTQMQRQDELADMINTTGTTFLGLTLGCARCHNHKFDPILQRDYYSMQAIFAGVQHGDRPLRRADAEGQRQAESLRRRIAELESRLGSFERSAESAQRADEVTPPADDAPRRETPRLIVIDDEDLGQTPGARHLADIQGHGTNPSGTPRGYRDDPGDARRVPNMSQGRYTWWQAEANQDLIAYHPAAAGRFRIWLSWGCGWHTHADDASYVLDLDGDLNTVADQQVLAVVDQRHFADGTQATGSQALWSGLRDVGIQTLTEASCIVLRGGAEQRAVTADVLVLQEVERPMPQGESDQGPTVPRFRPAVNARQNIDRFPAVEARYLRFTVLATNGGEPCLDELQVFASLSDAAPSDSLSPSVPTSNIPASNIALAAGGAVASSSGDFPNNPKHRLEHINDGQFGNSRSWISNQNGQGWVQIELPQATRIDRVAWGRDREQQYADRLATRYVIEVARQPGQWRVVASSNSRLPFGRDLPPVYRYAHLPLEQRELAARLGEELSDLRGQLESLESSRQLAYAGNFVTPPPTHRLHRGDPGQPRERVAPDALTVLGSLELAMDEPESQRRMALARWITAADHPLTARVIANRVWQHHFGAGLVATSSDFGANGASPSHPELLDWLAAELVRRQWSLKSLHRAIVLSATYRQSSQPRREALAVDAQCRLLWRFPTRRLEAEAIHDAILQVCGTLDLAMYGPGYSVFEPNSNYVRNYEPLRQWGPAQWRRMVYMTKVRMEQDAIFGSFDCPDAGQSAPNRSRSTTAIQALNLLNSPFMLQQAEKLAERLRIEVGDDSEKQIQRAFRLTTGQAPDAQQIELSHQLVAQHGLLPLCVTLLNTNEFLFLP